MESVDHWIVPYSLSIVILYYLFVQQTCQSEYSNIIIVVVVFVAVVVFYIIVINPSTLNTLNFMLINGE